MQATVFHTATHAIPSSVRLSTPKPPPLYFYPSSNQNCGPRTLSACLFQSRRLSTQSLAALHQIKQPTSKGGVFVFRSSSTDPYVNLSLEHYLLQNAHPESRVLFLYVNRPCVVIGRNQNPWVECALRKLSHEPLSLKGEAGIVGSNGQGGVRHGRNDVLLVRRRSGGGTVFHDEGNLNYSVIVPSHAKAEFKRKTHAEMVVRAVRGVQRDLMELSTPFDALEAAAETRTRPDTSAVEKMNVRVNERNDIVMDDPRRGLLKVSGSAFKLTKRRALHHGTLLFSSPNLDSIGEFLRSPARAFISAKGVESVRSPVGNLFDLLHGEQHRRMLRSHLEKRIADEFREMYDKEANGRLSQGEFTIGTAGELLENIASQLDDKSETGAEIMKGVREITSPEWTFEQTPGFVVSTKPVESEKGFSPPPSSATGLPDGANVFLSVRNGIMQEVEVSISSEEGAAMQEKQQIRSRLRGRKLHEISDWQTIFTGLDGPRHPQTERFVKWWSEMFPPLSTHSIKASELGLEDTKIENEVQEAGMIERQRADGVVELEREGERLVEEFGERDHSRTG